MKIIQKSLLVSLVALSQFSLFAETEAEYPLAQIVLAHEKSLTQGISRETENNAEVFIIKNNREGLIITGRLKKALRSRKVQRMPKSWEQTLTMKRQVYTDGVMSCRPVAYYRDNILMSLLTRGNALYRCTIARDDLEYYTDVIKDELEKSLINT